MATVNFVGANPDSVAWQNLVSALYASPQLTDPNTGAGPSSYDQATGTWGDQYTRDAAGNKRYFHIANGADNKPFISWTRGPDDANPFLTAVSTSIAPNTPAQSYNTTIAPALPVVLAMPYVAPVAVDPRINAQAYIDQMLSAGGYSYQMLATALGNTNLPYPELATLAALKARAKLMGIIAIDQWEAANIWQGPAPITLAGTTTPITLANISTPAAPAAPAPAAPIPAPFYLPGGDAVDPGTFGSAFGAPDSSSSSDTTTTTSTASLAPALGGKALAIGAAVVGLFFIMGHKKAA